jgi:alpha-1,3-rhamnosyltransferase
MIRIEQDGSPRRNQKFYPERILTFDDIFENRVKGPPAPTLMYIAEELRGIGGYREDILLEDFYTILAITSKGKKIGVMHDILAFYRSHPSNTYKNYSYMADNILKTYAIFADRPNYNKAISRYLNGMIKRVSISDKRLAIELLKKVPLQFYNRKTISGIFRIIFR